MRVQMGYNEPHLPTLGIAFGGIFFKIFFQKSLIFKYYYVKVYVKYFKIYVNVKSFEVHL
jgi:hypothetical protein